MSREDIYSTLNNIESRLDNLETILLRINENLHEEKNKSDILYVKDVARILKLSTQRIYQLAQEGKLPYIKSNGKILFKASDIITIT